MSRKHLRTNISRSITLNVGEDSLFSQAEMRNQRLSDPQFSYPTCWKKKVWIFCFSLPAIGGMTTTSLKLRESFRDWAISPLQLTKLGLISGHAVSSFMLLLTISTIAETWS